MWSNERAMNIVELPVGLVKVGDIIWYAHREYPVVNIVRLKDCTTLNYLLHSGKSGYFNFEHERIIQIVDKRNEFNIPAGNYTIQSVPELGHAIKPTFLPAEDNMETLNIQLAIEAQQILLQKLEQMLDLTQLAPTEDGKIAIGNCNIRVDKATVVKAARDEMKVAASKSAELIKKL